MKYCNLSSWAFFFQTTVLLFLISSCSNNKNTDESQFEELYKREENFKNQQFDSISQLCHVIDSVSSLVQDNRLKYLKNLVHGQLYYRIGEFDNSIERLRYSSIFLENTVSQDSLRAKIDNSIGVVFMAKCQYDSAIYYFNRSLRISERLGDKANTQISQFNHAQLYYEMENFDKALQIIDKILAQPANNDLKLKALHLKANLFGVNGMIDSAIIISKTAIKTTDIEKNISATSRFLNNLSLCYNEKGEFDSAIFYCKQSYLYDSLQNNETNMGANLMLLGEIFLKWGKPEIAESYFNKAIVIFDENKCLLNKRGAYQLLKELSIRKKNYKEALIFQDSIFAINNQINNIKVLQSITLLNIKYDTDKKNELIKIQNIELNWQRRLVWFISILSIVVIIVVYLLYQNKSKKEKLKIAKQREELSDMVFEAEQNERIRIARELHDSVGQKLAVTQMHLSMLNKECDEPTNVLSAIVNDTIQEIRTISHDLLPPDLSKGLINAVELLCDQLNYMNNFPKVHLIIPENTKKMPLNRNVEIISYRIIQELTSNSIKHSKAKNIGIEIIVDKINLKVLYTDDGIGFNQSAVHLSNGVGLKNIEERVQKLKGLIYFSSEVNMGVNYEFKFNYNQ